MDVNVLEQILQDNLTRKTKSNGNPVRLLERQFRKIDVNHDDRVSYSEFRDAIAPFVNGAPEESIEDLFSRWDTDGNGYLDSKEFVHSLFLSEQERQKSVQRRNELKEKTRRKSIKCEDIIEQAKKNRKLREAQEGLNFSTSNEEEHKNDEMYTKSDENKFRQDLIKDTQKKRKSLSEDITRPSVKTGAFGRGGHGERNLLVVDVNKIPKKIRYRVSKSWVSVHPGSNLNNSMISRSSTLPESTLRLQFIYGINSACSLHCLQNGEVVYASAGVGIVYNPKHHEQRFFLGHDDDITCLAVDPSLTLCATGSMGKSPVVYVWNVESMECIHTIGKGFFERMVSAVCFSGDSNQLVAIGADNHHMMGMWDISKSKQQPRLIASSTCQNGKPPQINAIFFHDFFPNHFATCGIKHIKFWRVDPADNRLKSKSGTFQQSNVKAPRKMCCGSFIGKEYTAITGGSNGYIYLWDTLKGICLRMLASHRGAVHSMTVGADLCVVTASQDRSLTTWKGYIDENNFDLKKLDIIELPQTTPVFDEKASVSTKFSSRRTNDKSSPKNECDSYEKAKGIKTVSIFRSSSGKPSGLIVGTVDNQMWSVVGNEWTYLMGGHSKSLYGLGVHRSVPKAFVTVGEDKVLHIWDAETKQVVRTIGLFDQARAVDISPDGNSLAVGYKNGSFSVIQVSSSKILLECKHCNETVDDIKFSPNGKRLGVASHENFIDIYDVTQKYTHISRCKGHNSFVTHFDWSRDSRMIQSNCGAYELLYWNADTGKKITSVEQTKDAKWETFTCILGFDVMGIWPEGSDGTDINSASRSPDNSLIVTGDDFGNVNLYNYPCIVDDAPCHTLNGHSSHVMNVRWLADGKTVISVGGCDKSVFQWQLLNRSECEKGSRFTKTSNLIGSQKKWKATTSWK